jgi:L-xylulose reductase
LIERKLPGSIVNVSSQASAAALKDHSVYCASKAAVDGLTRVMALELGAHQVRLIFSCHYETAFVCLYLDSS